MGLRLMRKIVNTNRDLKKLNLNNIIWNVNVNLLS